MTAPVSLADQIDAVWLAIDRSSRLAEYGYEKELTGLRAVLATLEAQPPMMAVIEAARDFVTSRNSIGNWDRALLHRLEDALAALPPAPEAANAPR